MTPKDRDILVSLRQQQRDLQEILARLDARLTALEAGALETVPEVAPSFPPLPVEASLPPIPPTAVAEVSAISFPPVPAAPAIAALPPVPSSPTPKPSFEFQFGRWLTRMGALLLVIGFVYFATLLDVTYHIHERLGPAGKLGIMGLASVLVIAFGQRLERNKSNHPFFGRTLMAAGLACLYVTIYAAHFYEPLRVITSPLLAGFLLLLWSAYVLMLAEQKKSEVLALFAITLAYIGTAINPVGSFTMAADLILAATAVIFQLRNGWAALSAFSLVGTYLALLRRLVVDSNGTLVLDTSRTLPFWPHAVYLICAWVIFTLAVILTTSATFRGGKRLAFLTLNNGALAGLLALTAYIAGYGASAMGWTLLDAGIVFLITSPFAALIENEPAEVASAYLAQGLALVTAGIMVVYTGITRGVLLLVETFFLGMSAALSGSRILIVGTYVAAFFSTLFLIWEVAVNAHHPWLLGCGGAVVMLINAWWARAGIRDSSLARSTLVLSSSYYCVLAVGLTYTALSSELGDRILPPALALAALALTFSIYYISLFELPPIAQMLLLAAQALVLFPAETGEALPWWSAAAVAAVTLLLITWWTRQRITRSGIWTNLLILIYALALARLATHAVHPYLSAQNWMIAASLLSVGFLAYGALTRVWAIALVGQIFLGVALYHLFLPPGNGIFPWSWWAAAVPIMATFATARAAHEWLRLFPEIPESQRGPLRLLAHGYRLVALAALVCWVFGIVPVPEQIAAFFFLGTLLLSLNVRRPDSFGIRCSYVLSAIGLYLYLANFPEQARAMATFLNAFALLLFLAQIPLLGAFGKSLVTSVESWILLLCSVGLSWIFVSAWVWTRVNPGSLTMSWALFALLLFLFGLLFREPRLRWCGLAVLFASIVRVFCHDFWELSSGYRVLTFLLLALIALGVGYILLRRNERTPPV